MLSIYRRSLVCAIAVASLATTAVASDGLDCSAKHLPNDAAFYSALLRNKEQIDIVLNSKAFAKLRELPIVQNAWEKVTEQLDQPLGNLPSPRELLKNPENRQLLELLADMAGQEIFFCGGPKSVAFLTFVGQVYGTAQFQQMMTQIQRRGQADDPKAQARAMLQALAANQDLIQVPDLIIGFRINDAQRAEAQLKRLDTAAKQVLEQVPHLKGRMKRERIGEGRFITLSLDGELVPWHEIPVKEIEEKPGEFDDVFKKLKTLKLTVTLGTSGNYLLLGIGESSSYLSKFAAGPDRLIERQEFKPLARFADRRITLIGYISKDLRLKMGMGEKDVDDMVTMAKSMLPMAELTKEQEAKVIRDVEDLAKDIRKYLPKPGAALTFSFLTNKGQESYGYDWSENNTWDASKPLSLLQHVGGSPLVATVGRSKYSPADYELVVKWIKKFHRHAEEFVIPKMEPEQQTAYDKFMKGATPLFQRLDAATGKLILPALADGQAAMVFDGKLTSTQWITMLPPTESALPMLEPALVLGVSDADKLRRGVAEYWDVAKKFVSLAREMSGEDVPPIELPDPKATKGKSGGLFTFELPIMIPVDKQIAPTAGLSDKVAVLTLSNAHAERLLANTPLKATGVLGNGNQKLATANVVNWAAAIDVATPWVDIAVRMAAPFADPVVGDSKDLPAQVHTLLDVLKVIRHYTSATYLEDGAWVTHGLTEIQDLK